jgi:hypothetical protein
MSHGDWIPSGVRLPEDGERVLCRVPGNVIHLPGKTGAVELREVVIMKFARDFFRKNPSRTGYEGIPHFWLGEGTSNRFFAEVSHWMRLPASGTP